MYLIPSILAAARPPSWANGSSPHCWSASASILRFCPESEITIEANPDDLSKDKLKALRDLGINRISLGVQSLDDGDLKYLGRSHSAKQALEALDLIRSCGFADLGVDLMYGLEIQTLPGWKRTIDKVLEFRPEHLSCYQLTIERGTPLWKMKAAGRVRAIGEKLETAFFVFTSRYLEKHGYLHYEISNFARSREYHVPSQPKILEPRSLPRSGSLRPFVPGWEPMVECEVDQEILRTPCGGKGAG